MTQKSAAVIYGGLHRTVDVNYPDAGGNQIGFLLLPTLAPMLMWMYLERSFIITVAVEGTMKGSVQPGSG